MCLKSIVSKLNFEVILNIAYITLFFFFLERQIHLSYYFTIKSSDLNVFQHVFYNYIYYLHSLFLGLILLSIRYKNNITPIILFLLNLIFIKYQSGFLYGADQLASRLLLVFIFINNYKKSPIKTIIGVKLLTAMVAAMYFHAGIEKVFHPEWINGKSLLSLLNQYLGLNINVNFTYLTMIISIITIGTQLSSIFLFHHKIKKILIPILLLMHIGIIFIFKLPFFGILCIIALLIILKQPRKKEI